MTEVSFIVIAYNEAERVERVLRSISAQTDLGDYEVIVIDDCSIDETAAVTKRYSRVDPAVRLVSHHTNHGRGAARASGIAAAGGHYIAMVDADIVLPPDWYRTCREALSESHAVSGTPIPDGDVQYLYTRFRLQPRARPGTMSINGSNALFRREVFDSVAFDPSFRNGEDIALSHAIARADLDARTLDYVTVEHAEGKDLLQSLAWMYESGIGATRQLFTFRELRGPDVAFSLWLGSVILGAWWTVDRRRAQPAALPIAALVAVSGAHVRGKFFLRHESPRQIASAVVVNSSMLAAYFTGRTVGTVATGLRIGKVRFASRQRSLPATGG